MTAASKAPPKKKESKPKTVNIDDGLFKCCKRQMIETKLTRKIGNILL